MSDSLGQGCTVLHRFNPFFWKTHSREFSSPHAGFCGITDESIWFVGWSIILLRVHKGYPVLQCSYSIWHFTIRVLLNFHEVAQWGFFLSSSSIFLFIVPKITAKLSDRDLYLCATLKSFLRIDFLTVTVYVHTCLLLLIPFTSISHQVFKNESVLIKV